jgi:LAO/AO transport system kinase
LPNSPHHEENKYSDVKTLKPEFFHNSGSSQGKFRNLNNQSHILLKKSTGNRLTVDEFESQIVSGNTVVLAQAITLAESNLTDDKILAEELINRLLPYTGTSIRIGITGVPGVGKSTLIEVFGKYITSFGKKLAVLAVDPTSAKTKGSILGDKTRMEDLAKEPLAFIRPTSSGLALGGVADCTREAILLCEAAGFDVIIIETVGVGQSETSVRDMVDFFLLLMLAGAGDELQGIKKGIMEMADAIVITKADGANMKQAQQAQTDFQHALHLFSPSDSGWRPKILLSSAFEKSGIKEIWSLIEEYINFVKSNGYFATLRSQQELIWFHDNMQKLLMMEMMKSDKIRNEVNLMEKLILDKKILPTQAARKIINDFLAI